jgi:hypothetical protein
VKRKPDGSLLISIVLHVVLGAGLLYVLSIPHPVQQWLKRQKPESIPVERISFVQLPNRGTNTPGRSGGNGRPVQRPQPAPPPLAAPTHVPAEVPPPPRPVPAPDTGSGPVVGKGGPAPGLTPSFSDPRLWLPSGPEVSAPKRPAERLDSALAARVRAHQDSLAEMAKNAGRRPGDWTFEKNGKKYGIDEHNIYIANLKIPSAILALLPLRQGANIQDPQRAHVAVQQHDEIMYQAQRAMNEDEFREAVKRIRERKDRERKAKQEEEKKAEQKTIAAP